MLGRTQLAPHPVCGSPCKANFPQAPVLFAFRAMKPGNSTGGPDGGSLAGSAQVSVGVDLFHVPLANLYGSESTYHLLAMRQESLWKWGSGLGFLPADGGFLAMSHVGFNEKWLADCAGRTPSLNQSLMHVLPTSRASLFAILRLQLLCSPEDVLFRSPGI